MREVDLTPNWENLAKFMARTLKYAEFDSDHAKYEFSTQYQEILGYLQDTNPDAWHRVLRFGNDLADGKVS